MSEERLQKVIAQAGVASRRAAEAMITEGRVRVNGRVVTTLGAKADPSKDRIDVDGKRVVAEKPAYYVLHKPRGVVTTLDDPEGRQTIAQLVKAIPERVFPVGRLDYHTSGVLLVTNDGAMSQALLHPRRTVPKTYVAKVRGSMDVEQLDLLRNGVELGGGEVSRKAEVFVLREERGNTWIQLTITEGKNRQIHRMVEAIGSRVGRLARVAFAGLTVEGLRPGEHRELGATELHKLKRDYLNPQKRAVAAEVRKEALEAAMFALGYDPGNESDEEDSGPIIERRGGAAMEGGGHAAEGRADRFDRSTGRGRRSGRSPDARTELRVHGRSGGGRRNGYAQSGGREADGRGPGPSPRQDGAVSSGAFPGRDRRGGGGFQSEKTRHEGDAGNSSPARWNREPQREREGQDGVGPRGFRRRDGGDARAGVASRRDAPGGRSASHRPPASAPTVEVMTVRRRTPPPEPPSAVGEGGSASAESGAQPTVSTLRPTHGVARAPHDEQSAQSVRPVAVDGTGAARSGQDSRQNGSGQGAQEPNRRRVVRKVVAPRNPPVEQEPRKAGRRRKSD